LLIIARGEFCPHAKFEKRVVKEVLSLLIGLFAFVVSIKILWTNAALLLDQVQNDQIRLYIVIRSCVSG